MTKPTLCVFAGSVRRDSVNRKLAAVAATSIDKAGGNAVLLELSDYVLPLYDGDLEASDGVPQAAKQLCDQLAACDGFLIAAPEYNSSITPVLKNAIDWITRVEVERGKEPFMGKLAAIVSASPGGMGGMRGLVHLRDILGNIGVTVIPEERALRAAHEAFAEDGTLKEARELQSLEKVAKALVNIASAKINYTG